MIARLIAAKRGPGQVCPFSDDERGDVLRAVNKVQQATGISLEYMGHVYCWSDGLAAMDINGMFRRQEPRRIYIRSDWKGMTREAVPTICHELMHSKQYREMGGLKFALLSVPLFYAACLDTPAIRLEIAAEGILGFRHSEGAQ